ncbi:hypothetical protein Poli38472_002637 [Pythium oligandrum]|uniref:Uncharacterized protein n=1 Tax=Pythium oligandrum TaxID=41045 RepID=A0A8K1CHK1_PYTOL|nr:hypothetical protein Poli38472_002637 [Pythium oligandrum]|eukprot:TMW63696.1 hypothetical protein Poli38472_002637 [Pythium oligandrum]
MPLLWSSSSAGPTKKIQSPPTEEHVVRTRSNSVEYGSNQTTDAACEPLAASHRPARARFGMRDGVYAVVVLVGVLTMGLMFHNHYHDDAAHAGRLFHAAEAKNPLLRTDTLDREGALRLNALNTLIEDLPALPELEVRRSVRGELNTTIHVREHQFQFGPISFWTRSYEGSIPGPMLSIQPGDTLNLHLVNELEQNVPGEWAPNTYHHPNTTNLHVHGMHVDPTGIADNVLRVVEPGKSLFTQIHVPANHPRGLFHYHPHYHGSVFLQMSGGMMGPLLVEDDAETLPKDYRAMKTHVLALQEFRFDGGIAADLRKAAEASRSKLDMNLAYTHHAVLDTHVRTLFPHVHRPSEAIEEIPMATSLAERPALSRFFVVNGAYLPRIDVQPNENVRLRFLNAGGSSTLQLAVPACSFHLIANDGNYLSQPRPVKLLFLSPGARADVVINCEANDPSDPHRESLRPLQAVQDVGVNDFLGASSDVFQGVLAFVHVSGPSREMGPVTSVPPPPALYAGVDLRTLSDDDRAKMDANPLHFEFTMGGKVKKDGFKYKNYFINHALFSLDNVLREMPLGVVQEWVIINQQDESGKATNKNHPFHLHTNAFQIVDMSHGEGVDYKIGDWRDVIAVPTPGNVTIRFRPVDFKGPVVAHCHILGHSDAGMVALVKIV